MNNIDVYFKEEEKLKNQNDLNKKNLIEVKDSLDKDRIILKKQKFYGGGEAIFSWEWLGKKIAKRYYNNHFNFEMLLAFIKKEKLGDSIQYFSSEEMKENPKLNESEDLKSFITTAVINTEKDEEQKRKANPFLQLEQKFYNAKTKNFKLLLLKEDFKMLQDKEFDEFSGIYFNVVK